MELSVGQRIKLIEDLHKLSSKELKDLSQKLGLEQGKGLQRMIEVITEYFMSFPKTVDFIDNTDYFVYLDEYLKDNGKDPEREKEFMKDLSRIFAGRRDRSTPKVKHLIRDVFTAIHREIFIKVQKHTPVLLEIIVCNFLRSGSERSLVSLTKSTNPSGPCFLIRLHIS